MTASHTLYLIRHPRPLIAPGVCYGRLDVAAEDPLPIAATLRALLPADAPVWSSPLQRCRLLAGHLHPQPRLDERLQESNLFVEVGVDEGVERGVGGGKGHRCSSAS